MRIVVDLQACQSHASSTRGIGRYSMALLKAMLRNAGDDEIIVALNGELAGSIEPVRAELAGLLPQQRIVVWSATPEVAAEYPVNDWRRAAAAQIRQAFLEDLHPDVVHVSSWFEGFIDDSVTTPGVRPPGFATAVTLYDLIPLVHEHIYLKHPRHREWYFGKIEELKRADLLLGISRHSCHEALERLGLQEGRVANISAAVDPMFRRMRLPAGEADAVLVRHGLSRRFLMYTGGIDHRKNIEGLIRAYARLPSALRRECQLAIVCRADAPSMDRLQRLGADEGLLPGQLVMTGYVSDADLLSLYNLCEAFIFPSWHEGFGLPVLEAMACGAAVIGANTSSIPEVIDCEEALFDPHNIRAMAEKMERVLTDGGLRARLREHGLQRAAVFSWDECGQRALAGMRALHARGALSGVVESVSKPLLAYVSPLPPQPSGVADYSADLLPELAKFYRIEAISDQTEISDRWSREHVPLRSTAWFEQHADDYDRILYHIGNGLLHAEMLPMLERHPGTVALHEVYLSGITSHLEWASKVPGYWTRSLYESHGYPALVAREHCDDPEKMLERYPCSLAVIRDAQGIIVHSLFARRIADKWFGEGTSRDWTVAPLWRAPVLDVPRTTARRNLGLSEDDVLVCCFGILGVFKRNLEIIEGWLASNLANKKRCRLVFVGGSLNPAYDHALRKLTGGKAAGQIEITGWVGRDRYREYLAAADIAVQMRGSSRGEASGTVNDCLAYGLATIVNAHGPFMELPQDAVLAIPDMFTSNDLAQALERLANDSELRRSLGEQGRRYCREELEPQRIAALYRDAIEAAATAYRGARKLAGDIADATGDVNPSSVDLQRVASGMAANASARIQVKQLLVDISELVRRDAKSGIQRVVRSVLSVLLTNPPDGFRVEPIFANPGERYRYARSFTAKFLGLSHSMPPDEPIDIDPGDVFLGLDLCMAEIPANIKQFHAMRDRGVPIWFVVHDVLPVARSDCFAPHIRGIYANWVKAFAEVGDGAICVSRTVADELRTHLDSIQAPRLRPFHIGWFHHGADIASSLPTTGISDEEKAALKLLRGGQAMLMVGTLEPRKGHAQALDAFELLWAQGHSARLVIVGKAGWMTEALVERLRNHPEKGARLFWFEGASDELLMRLYEECSGLLVASEGEGFGLPLIEAAQHGLPILCRDLPVFIEVAGAHASYFSGFDPGQLADALQEWLAMRSRGAVPQSADLPRLTWEQASTKLLKSVFGGPWHVSWMPGQRFIFPAYDPRLETPCGERQRNRIVATGTPGVLLRSWPFQASGGRYRVNVTGEWLVRVGEAHLTLHRAEDSEPVASWPLSHDETARGSLLEAEMLLPGDSSDLEWRITVERSAQLAISALEWQPLSPEMAGVAADPQEPTLRVMNA